MTLLYHYKSSGKIKTVILSAYKKPCTVILNKNNCVCKVDQIVEDGITEVKYIETSDNTLFDLKRFQDFLYHHRYKHKIMKQCVHVLIILAV